MRRKRIFNAKRAGSSDYLRFKREFKNSGLTIASSVPAGAVFTDTHVTSVSNNYVPSSGGSATIDSSGGESSDNQVVVTGVVKDAAGHIVSMQGRTVPNRAMTADLRGTAILGSDTMIENEFTEPGSSGAVLALSTTSIGTTGSRFARFSNIV